jgi:hypothetical protein
MMRRRGPSDDAEGHAQPLTSNEFPLPDGYRMLWDQPASLTAPKSLRIPLPSPRQSRQSATRCVALHGNDRPRSLHQRRWLRLRPRPPIRHRIHGRHDASRAAKRPEYGNASHSQRHGSLLVRVPQPRPLPHHRPDKTRQHHRNRNLRRTRHRRTIKKAALYSTAFS